MKQTKKQKPSNEFECPSCGNPLKESTRDKIRCRYCQTIIVPKSRFLQRQAEIYQPKPRP